MEKIITLSHGQIESLEAKVAYKDIVSDKVRNINAFSDSVSEVYSSPRGLRQFRIPSNKASERLRKHRNPYLQILVYEEP